ncbi:MAG TPA: peptidylprolyl isomerase [Phycisphaerae bacterium]|nr:peptidylprolyl isomerase [Phycisphaerae bacterium]
MRRAAFWWAGAGTILSAASAVAQVSVAPPTSAPAPSGAEPLLRVRADQPLTINALAGFVNAEPIFVQDVLRPIDKQLRQMAQSARTLNEFKQDAQPLIHAQLQNYIYEILMMSKAKATLTDEEKAGVDTYMRKMLHDLLADYGGSRALADQALRPQGSSVDREMTDLRRRLTWQVYMDKEISPRIVVTRQMVLDAYQRDPKRWQQQPELELFTISIPVARWLHAQTSDGTRGPLIANPTPEQVKSAESQAMAAADDVVKQLKNGADFAQLAEDYSADKRANAGGRFPHVKRGDLADKRIEDYAFSLPANTLGQPQLLKSPDPTQSAVVVIKVGQKQEGRTIPFAEAQQQIAAELHDQQRTQLQAEFLTKLEATTPVENENRMEDMAMDVAVSRYALGQ